MVVRGPGAPWSSVRDSRAPWLFVRGSRAPWLLISRGGVEDTRLEAKDTKKSEAKDSLSEDRHFRGQGHKRKCSPKKRSSQKFVGRSPKKKRSSQKFFRRSLLKNVFQKIFQALHKILTIQKIVLFSNRGQVNFRGLEASRPRT